MNVILILALAAAVVLPDPHLTPGKRNRALTRARICSSSFRTRFYRRVTDASKKKVCRLYRRPLPCPDGHYEIDHLIPLELGGSNDLANLWPQPYRRPGAREKDVLESALHRQVCAGGITLQEAQKIMLGDWYGAYRNLNSSEPAAAPKSRSH